MYVTWYQILVKSVQLIVSYECKCEELIHKCIWLRRIVCSAMNIFIATTNAFQIQYNVERTDVIAHYLNV